jgi:hypothetical protein
LSVRTNLETAQVSNPSVNLIVQTYKDGDKTVAFEEIKVEEFKNLRKVEEENEGLRRTFSRRSISIQNPIPDQNATVGELFKLTIEGSNVFSSTSSLSLEAKNISTWLTSYCNPVFEGSYDKLGSSSFRIAVSGNYTYVAMGLQGLQIIDISNPSNPTFKGSYDTPDYAREVAVSGNYAYVADNSALQIIDIADPSNPIFKGSYNTPGRSEGVALSGNYAYVAAYSAGLQIIDITDPSNPTLKGSYYDTPAPAFEVALFGNYAYVTNYAYLTSYDSNLEIIDINDPSNPTFKGSYNTPDWANGVAFSGNSAYAAAGDSGLQIIDISNTSNPIFKDSYDTPGYAYGVAVSSNYAYVAAGRLHIIDISDPSNPTFKGSYDTPGMAQEVALSGNYAYVADVGFRRDISSLQIIALNPDKLTLSGTPSSIGTYGVDIKACNEIMECVTDSFDIIVKEHLSTDLSTTLVIIGSTVGACIVCIVSFCFPLIIGGGVVVLKRYRNKDESTASAEEHSKEEKRQKSESKISNDDTQIVEYDLDSDGRKVPMVPEQTADTELNVISNSTEDKISKIENVPDAPNDLEYDKEPPKKLCCPISSKLMKNPVIVVESGQTYDKESIMTWLAKHETDPLTGKEITNIQFAINYAIKRQVEEWVTKHKIKK